MEAALVLGGTLIVLYIYSQRTQPTDNSSDNKDPVTPAPGNNEPKPQMFAKPGQKKSILHVR